MATSMQNIDARNGLSDPLHNFPIALSGALCWDSNAFRNANYKYIIHLSPEDISAIENAIAFFKSMLANPCDLV